MSEFSLENKENKNNLTESLSRVEKLKALLEKMNTFINENNLFLDQKRLYRESKAINILTKFHNAPKIRGFKIDEALTFNQNFHSPLSNKESVTLPQNLETILNFIENELDEKMIRESYSSCSEGGDSKRRNIVSKENLKKYFFDLEYKIKMEIKKEELEKNGIVNNFIELSLNESAHANPQAPIRFRNPFEFIKNNFLEDKEITNKKRSSCFDKSPRLNIENYENFETFSFENSDEEDEEDERVERVTKKKEKKNRRGSLMIKSSLFG